MTLGDTSPQAPVCVLCVCGWVDTCVCMHVEALSAFKNSYYLVGVCAVRMWGSQLLTYCVHLVGTRYAPQLHRIVPSPAPISQEFGTTEPYTTSSFSHGYFHLLSHLTSSPLPPLFLRQGLTLNLELMDCLGWLAMRSSLSIPHPPGELRSLASLSH